MCGICGVVARAGGRMAAIIRRRVASRNEGGTIDRYVIVRVPRRALIVHDLDGEVHIARIGNSAREGDGISHHGIDTSLANFQPWSSGYLLRIVEWDGLFAPRAFKRSMYDATHFGGYGTVEPSGRVTPISCTLTARAPGIPPPGARAFCYPHAPNNRVSTLDR